MKKAIVLLCLAASFAFVFVIPTLAKEPIFKPMIQHGNG